MRSSIKKAILGVNVEMNEAHGDTLIEGLMEKPRLPEPVKLVGTDTCVSGINANEEAHCLPSPPVGGFPPPAK